MFNTNIFIILTTDYFYRERKILVYTKYCCMQIFIIGNNMKYYRTVKKVNDSN